MRTPKNILRHELIGLPCEVIGASNKAHIGIRGVIRDETMKMVMIGKKKIAKQGSTFRLALGDVTVDIEGDRLLARPEDRIKKQVKRW